MTRVYAERTDRAQLFSDFSAILRHGISRFNTQEPVLAQHGRDLKKISEMPGESGLALLRESDR
jgi:hypothetical protein